MGRALNRARPTERRHSPRRSGEALSWIREFRLRPRLDATLVNLSEEGAVIETSAYLCPGVRTFIHLAGPSGVWRVAGQVARSWVAPIVTEYGVRYRGALRFDRQIDLSARGPEPGPTRAHSRS
jgi:hypothetical protein